MTDDETKNITMGDAIRVLGVVIVVLAVAALYLIYNINEQQEQLDACKADCEAVGYPRGGLGKNNVCMCGDIAGNFKPYADISGEPGASAYE